MFKTIISGDAVASSMNPVDLMDFFKTVLAEHSLEGCDTCGMSCITTGDSLAIVNYI